MIYTTLLLLHTHKTPDRDPIFKWMLMLIDLAFAAGYSLCVLCMSITLHWPRKPGYSTYVTKGALLLCTALCNPLTAYHLSKGFL